MKLKLLIMTAAALIFAGLSVGAAQTRDVLHTPKKGGAERRAILDALRGGANTKYRVNFLKVHNGWAWIDATPLDARGKAIAEGGPFLLNLEENNWTLMDLSLVPFDPDNPMGAEDVSRVYLANLKKTYPGVPLDICPKPRT